MDTIIKALKKDILKNLESDNLDGVKEALFLGLFMGFPEILNDSVLEQKSFSSQIKLVKLGADLEPLVQQKIRSDAFYDLIKLDREFPGQIDWSKKTHLFYDKLQTLDEKSLYKERIDFFVSQISLKKVLPEASLINSYDRIVFEIQQNLDYSVFNRLKKIIDAIPDENKKYVIDKATNYAINQQSNSIYALYQFYDLSKNSTFNHKFATAFMEKKNGFYAKDLFEKSSLKVDSFTSVKDNSKTIEYKKFNSDEHFEDVVLKLQKKSYLYKKKLNEKKLTDNMTGVAPRVESQKPVFSHPEEVAINPFMALSIYAKRDNKPQQLKELVKLVNWVEPVEIVPVSKAQSIESIEKNKQPSVTYVKNLAGETVLRKDLQKNWDTLLIQEFYNDYTSMSQVVARFLSENKLDFDTLNEQNANLNRMPMAKIKDHWKSPRLFVCGYLSEAADLMLAKKSQEVLLNVDNYARLFSVKKIKTSEQKLTFLNPDVKAEIREIRKTQTDYNRATRERVIQRNSLSSLRRSSWNTVK